jgi:deoxyribodipyrimidine photo-lyase
MNFVYFNRQYDSYDCLPEWAKKTLQKPREDRRAHIYARDELEHAQTHDPYWNAALQEMILTGFMPNYMRMYWGKKILEWTKIPEDAFQILLYLNNKYFLDGRDPNSFTNVAWCLGLHDRPWKERPIFGMVRYLSVEGLKRKFTIAAYAQRVCHIALQKKKLEDPQYQYQSSGCYPFGSNTPLTFLKGGLRGDCSSPKSPLKFVTLPLRGVFDLTD